MIRMGQWEERSPFILFSGWKLLILAIGTSAAIAHFLTPFSNDFFIWNTILFLVLTVVSFAVPFAMQSVETKWLKVGDSIFHGIAAIIMLVSAGRFLNEIVTLSEQARENYARRNDNRLVPTTGPEPSIDNAEAYAAAILGIIQGIVHALLVIMIWLRKY